MTTPAQLFYSDVSRETHERLELYVQLLLRWQPRINLVSPTTIPDVWTRHVADSWQIVDLAPQAKLWLDLGSGAGFPGLVIAIALKERMPGGLVHLVESNGKKCAFLREVIRETGAAAALHQGRIEDVLVAMSSEATGMKFDVVTARALANLDQLLSWSHQVLKTQTRALFPKGQDVATELTDAAKCWNLDYRLHPSTTSSDGCIVEILKAERR